MSEFKPESLFNRVIKGVCAGGYPPDIVNAAFDEMSDAELQEWLDSPQSAEWIRRASQDTSLPSGRAIILEAIIWHLMSVAERYSE